MADGAIVAKELVYLFLQIPNGIGRFCPIYYSVVPIVGITQRGGTWSDVALEGLVHIRAADLVPRRSKHQGA